MSAPFTKELLLRLAETEQKKLNLPGADWIREHGERLKTSISAHLIKAVKTNPFTRETEFLFLQENYGIGNEGLELYQRNWLTEQFPGISLRFFCNNVPYFKGFSISW